MSAFAYGVALQLKLDIRSKTLLVTCYIVPLLFFALMGGIFTAVTPEMKATLIQSMCVMGVSMGALIGLPPTVVGTYGSDIKKVYKSNGVPLYLGLVSMFISSLVHLLIMCALIYIIAPIAFDATLPENPALFYAALAIFTAVSLSIGCSLGLLVKNQSRLTMFSQLVFLPSIMLSGIMFPADFLPDALSVIGKAFPATWGYKLMIDGGFVFGNLCHLMVILAVMAAVCGLLLKKCQSE